MRPEDGHIDTLEINDELEDLMREGWSRAGVADKITLHIGDARETLSTLEGPYDIVYMDANKREYVTYYNLVFDLVRPGGLILADDVLWDGKLWQDPVPQDKQTQGIIAFNDLIVNDPRVESFLLPPLATASTSSGNYNGLRSSHLGLMTLMKSCRFPSL